MNILELLVFLPVTSVARVLQMVLQIFRMDCECDFDSNNLKLIRTYNSHIRDPHNIMVEVSFLNYYDHSAK